MVPKRSVLSVSRCILVPAISICFLCFHGKLCQMTQRRVGFLHSVFRTEIIPLDIGKLWVLSEAVCLVGKLNREVKLWLIIIHIKPRQWELLFEWGSREILAVDWEYITASLTCFSFHSFLPHQNSFLVFKTQRVAIQTLLFIYSLMCLFFIQAAIKHCTLLHKGWSILGVDFKGIRHLNNTVRITAGFFKGKSRSRNYVPFCFFSYPQN